MDTQRRKVFSGSPPTITCRQLSGATMAEIPDFPSAAESRRTGTSHPNTVTAAIVPRVCATINAGTSRGLIPAKLFVIARATVTAGLAKDVDAVNQYAAPI